MRHIEKVQTFIVARDETRILNFGILEFWKLEFWSFFKGWSENQVNLYLILKRIRCLFEWCIDWPILIDHTLRNRPIKGRKWAHQGQFFAPHRHQVEFLNFFWIASDSAQNSAQPTHITNIIVLKLFYWFLKKRLS